MKVLIFTILFINSAFGEVPCSDVNLSYEKKWGKAAFLLTGKNTRWDFYNKQMPPYDQGQTGICFAYAAIQMVDYWRQTMGIRVTKEIMLSSPLYATLLTRIFKDSRFYKKRELEGGDMESALGSIRGLGMCREDIIQEGLNQFAKKRDLDQREFLEIVELLFSNFPGDPMLIQSMPSKEIWKKYIDGKFSFYGKRQINENGKIAQIFQKVAPYIENGDIVRFMDDLFAECKKPTSIYVGTRRIPPPTNKVVRSTNKEFFKDHIRGLLRERNAQPVGVEYCSKFLLERNYLGRFPDPNFDMQMVAKDNKECGNHASILMGMTNIGGKCHYLLKNSWGVDCKYDWQCRFDAYKEAVGIWVEEEALLNNLGSIAYLRHKDFLCLARTFHGEEFFEMDRPSYPMNAKNFIYLFNRSELLFVGAEKDGKISFHFGKDSSTLYTAQKFDEKDFKTPFQIGLSLPKKGLSIKLTCLPNGPNRTQIESNLKKLNN